jgi:hypothetical protein
VEHGGNEYKIFPGKISTDEITWKTRRRLEIILICIETGCQNVDLTELLKVRV